MYEVDTETPPEQKISPVKKVFTALGAGVYEIIETLVIALAVVVFVYLFIASPHEVIGRSMEPNFWDGEYLLADKISYHFKDAKRGDVVIFKQTATADYIKRIIAFPGETVELRDGHFYVNGNLLDESEYLESSVYTDGQSYLKEGQTITVPENTYFVAGDNRPHSSDSRAFGPVDQDRIKGRALVIYWPFSHFSIINRPTYSQ